MLSSKLVLVTSCHQFQAQLTFLLLVLQGLLAFLKDAVNGQDILEGLGSAANRCH